MELDNIIHEITKNIKQYPNQPQYYIAVYSGACSFELLVNDMPAYKYYDRDNIGGQPFPVNMYIPKSGAQTWSLKVLPPTSPKKDSLMPGLVDDGYFRLVLKIKDWKAGTDMATLDTLYEAPSVLKNGERFLAAAGQPLIVANGRFGAEVPYDLPGWSNSVNLAKEDKDDLLKEVIAVYEKEREWLEDKNTAAELAFSKNAKYEFMQSMYQGEKAIKESLSKSSEIAKSQDFKVKSLENYIICFYGNGHVVSLERVDLKNRGESALRMSYKKNDHSRVIFQEFLLHRPRPGAPLEPIR